MAEEEFEGVAPPSGGLRVGLGYHLEGLIPIILVLIVAAVAGSYLGFWSLPFISTQKPIQMLVIGNPSLVTRAALDTQQDLVRYVVRDPFSLRVSPKEVFAQYDMVMLDQTDSPTKAIPRQVAEALSDYVRKGGKLIIVMNSGIYREGAPEIVGWEANFPDLVPVACVRQGTFGEPSCITSRIVVGEIVREDFDHPIMKGIEVVPATPEQPLLQLETFPVQPTGNEIAYIQNAQTPEYFPAIVEKRLILGKVIYFNYDPGITVGIFTNTLRYLRGV